MTETLGIHISDAGIAAATGSADTPTGVVPLRLGKSGWLAASAVAAGADGAVLVGDAALGVDGPTVSDPLDRARHGRTGALTAVITHVAGRVAIASRDATTPSRLAIVAPDDFEGDHRDMLVTAANAAGFTDVVVVPRSAAQAQTSSVEPELRCAVGAVLIASVDAAPPLVTREDLGQVVLPAQPAPTPAAPRAEGPTSVFDEDPEPTLPPVRESPSPVESAPRPRPAAPVAAPTSMVAPPPLNPVARPVSPALVGVGAGLVLVILLVIALKAVGGDSGTDTAAVATTSTEAPTTTEVATTSTTSTTTSTSTTSTVAVETDTSTTSSTTTTTTTTTPVPVGTPGPVTLVETGLQFDTGVVVQFGQDDSVVLLEAAAVLGIADSDSGYVVNDFCDGALVRFVKWGNLELVFTGGPDGSPVRFSQWYVDGHLSPVGLVTLDGLGESATVGFLDVTYPTALVLVPAFPDDIVGVFAVTNPETGAVLNGTTLGLDPQGVVTTLWAGNSCTRVFT